jgi:hypothetical protein
MPTRPLPQVLLLALVAVVMLALLPGESEAWVHHPWRCRGDTKKAGPLSAW